jgi:serpin B
VISQIAHRSAIEVDEEGTVASAATVAELAFKSESIVDVSFRVDRPFLFYLVDDKTGAILFQGRTMDPRRDPR